jgi:hypothetical protein
VPFDASIIDNAPVLVDGNSGLIWVHSDLQLGNPELAEKVFTAAVDDVLSLGLKLDAAACLGDALVGKVLPSLEAVAQVCIRQMARLNIPVCYVLGNHEQDLRRDGPLRWPLYELAQQNPNWHVLTKLDDFFFARKICGTLVVFMGDHAGQTWLSTHGTIQGEKEAYPYSPADYQALRDAIAKYPGPVVTLSHYAYPGGQRPSALQGHMLPLPNNVWTHLYGHAHIGDLVHNKERPYQRDNPIDGQPLRQFNISALETARSAGSHSAFLKFDNGEPVEIRIRCHQQKQWTETFPIQKPHA